ncbi:MAG: hypothetical protein LBB04_01760 [Oscillospiraceae bacterium]|jgi:cation transport ATPase|nr:hypothetical protein [Oscillospiraceae bacterium]
MVRKDFSVDDILREVREKRRQNPEKWGENPSKDGVNPALVRDLDDEDTKIRDLSGGGVDGELSAVSREGLTKKREKLAEAFVENNDIQAEIDGDHENPELGEFFNVAVSPEAELLPAVVEETQREPSTEWGLRANEIRRGKRFLGIQLTISFASFLVLLWLFFVNTIPFVLPELLRVVPLQNTAVLLNVGCLLVPITMSSDLVLSGFWQLLKFKAFGESLVSLSLLGALIQGVVCLAKPYVAVQRWVNAYGIVAVAVLFFCLLNRYILAYIAARNYRLVEDSKTKGYVFKKLDKGSADQLGYLMESDRANICMASELKDFKGFPRGSRDYYDGVCKFLAPVVFFASLLGISFLALREDYVYAVMVGACFLSMSAPLAGNLCCSIFLLGISKRLWKFGAGVCSLHSLDAAVSADAVIVSAEDLVDKAHVRLFKMELFEEKSVDLAILSSASVLSAADVEFADVFVEMLAERKMLKSVEGLNIEGDMGFTGWLEGKRVLFGTRELMINHGVRTPSRDLEKVRLVVKPGEFVSKAQYVAVDGILLAMFILGYKPIPRAQKVLFNLRKSKLGIIVMSKDSTLSGNFVELLYGVDEGTIDIVPRFAKKPFKNVDENEEPEIFLGERLFGLSTILTSAKRAQINAKIATFIQGANLLLGLGLVVYLVACGDLKTVSSVKVLGYHSLWLCVNLLISLVSGA